jgi:hypothetical protein
MVLKIIQALISYQKENVSNIEKGEGGVGEDLNGKVYVICHHNEFIFPLFLPTYPCAFSNCPVCL